MEAVVDVRTLSILIVAPFIAVTVLQYWRTQFRSHRHPPGPPGWPIIGNILKVAPQGVWTTFTKYKEQYGDMLFFHGLGNHVLVLNSIKAINDLLDKRGHNYTDRPMFTVVGDLMGLGQSMALLPYGEEWRAQRKLAHTALSPNAVKRYHFVQEDLAALLCRQLLQTPADFFDHVRLTAGRLVLSVTYGLPVETADDEYITQAEETMLVIGKATVPGAFLCDLIPWLKYLPSWVPFQQEAKKGREMIERLVTKPLEHVKREMAAGIAPPSLARDLLSAEAEDMVKLENRVKWAAGSMYGAGGETTYATVLVSIMAMALHPEKQRLAQAEIDRIVGTDRLPLISDCDSLPYVNAFIKETMRWHPVLPLSLARQAATDDIYEGAFIPKATIIMPNVWAIAFTHHPRYDEHSFVPERFLEAEDAPLDPSTWAFGFGRRVCPGKHLAENSIFILIASILAVLDISPHPDEELEPDFTQNLISYPKPFKCCISPRSDAYARLVMYRAAQHAG